MLMFNEAIKAANNGAADAAPATTTTIAEMLGHSVVLGVILMVAAFLTTGWMEKIAGDSPDERDPIQQVLAAANYLFLCTGMTGVMLMVSNSLARAFAIGAAISLIRFRIKVDGKGVGTMMLFSLLIGMACGVDQIAAAWGFVIVFGILQIILVTMIGIVSARERARKERKQAAAGVVPVGLTTAVPAEAAAAINRA